VRKIEEGQRAGPERGTVVEGFEINCERSSAKPVINGEGMGYKGIRPYPSIGSPWVTAQSLLSPKILQLLFFSP